VLTDRGKGLLIAAAALWVIARSFGIREVQIAAVAVLAVVVAAVVFTIVASARLSTRRVIHPPRVFFDTEAAVEVRLRNEGRLPTAVLQVEDQPPAILCDNARFVLRPLPSGHSVAMRYTLTGRQRGRFAVGPLSVRLRDPFGIASRAQRYGDTDEVVVYPAVWRLPAGLPLGGTIGTGGEGRPRPLASGEELANVREYVRGDDLRKVHWRSTAHRARLMVRQDEAPQNPQVTVVLDVRDGVHFGSGPASSFETAVSAAASTTYHLAERGFQTALLTRPTAQAGRPVSWQLALEQLAVIEPDAGADLAGLWQQLGQGSGGGGLLAAVVAVPDAALLRQMVRAGRGYTTRLALLIDTTSWRRTGRHGSDVERTADALRAAEWRVAIVKAGDRLDHRWRDLLLQRRRGAA
jgi:uncharacterized protein (DUF58 family)